MTFYLIQAGDQYFSSGGSWVNDSGLCDKATWVSDLGSAWCTSSIEHAEAVASYNGGWVMSLEDAQRDYDTFNKPSNGHAEKDISFWDGMAERWRDVAQMADEDYRTAKDPQASLMYRSSAKTARRGLARSKRKADEIRKKQQEDEEMSNGTAKPRRLKVKTRPTSVSSQVTRQPTKDHYTERQEQIHKATAQGASYLHLVGGTFLGVIQSFFKRTFLSVVAAGALLGGMVLAGIGYAIAMDFMPQSLFPDNQSIGNAYQALIQWFQTAQTWQKWGFTVAMFLSVIVQCYQSWSIYTLLNGVNASKQGGKSIFSNRLHRFLFYVVTGFVWWLDFQAIGGVSFAGGVVGLALWVWAAFPSEIAAMILQIQKAAKED
jgi:hypothetical protein